MMVIVDAVADVIKTYPGWTMFAIVLLVGGIAQRIAGNSGKSERE